MSDSVLELTEKVPSLGDLEKVVRDEMTALQQAQAEEMAARSRVDDACKRMNAAMAAFDAQVAKVQKNFAALSSAA